MARNKRNSQTKFDLSDRAMALLTASMGVTKALMSAKEDLAKDPNDEHAQSALELLEITIAVLVDWGVELTEAIDKEYDRSTDKLGEEMRCMLHEVFQVPLVN
jgi:hypothetical protein